MSFRIRGLDPAPFRHLYGLPDEELVPRKIRRYRVTERPGFPDRIEMRDLELGETALLLNYTHQPADTPYRASHAILIREGATAAYDAVDEVPEVIRVRAISVRAFNDRGEMLDADLAPGTEIEPMIRRFLADPATSYLHAHYAQRGCFAALIERT